MQQYIVRRVVLMIPTLLIVSTMVFAMVRIMPGDVAIIQLSESPNFNTADVEALREQLGLNEPVVTDYLNWLGGLVRGDLGKSLWSSRSVTTLIVERIPVTLELAIMASIMASVIAMTVGVLSAIRQNSFLDYILRFMSIGGLSIPNFWIATMVIVMGARYLNYLPPLSYVPFFDDPTTNLQQFFLPSVILAIGLSAINMRMVRSSMLEVLRQDYIRTAWAKGLRERFVIYRHALKNAFLPVLTLQGVQLAYLLTGSLLIEIIFNLHGLGFLAYDAVLKRDYTLIQGTTLFFGFLFVGINLLVDVGYTWLDPRIKFSTQRT